MDGSHSNASHLVTGMVRAKDEALLAVLADGHTAKWPDRCVFAALLQLKADRRAVGSGIRRLRLCWNRSFHTQDTSDFCVVFEICKVCRSRARKKEDKEMMFSRSTRLTHFFIGPISKKIFAPNVSHLGLCMYRIIAKFVGRLANLD